MLLSLLGAALLGGVARAAGPDHTREIVTGVWYPWVQFGKDLNARNDHHTCTFAFAHPT